MMECACFPQFGSEWHFVRSKFALAVCADRFHAVPHRTTTSNPAWDGLAGARNSWTSERDGPTEPCGGQFLESCRRVLLSTPGRELREGVPEVFQAMREPKRKGPFPGPFQEETHCQVADSIAAGWTCLCQSLCRFRCPCP